MYGRLVKIVVIWYIFPYLVCLEQEKSGNPGFNLFHFPDFLIFPFPSVSPVLPEDIKQQYWIRVNFCELLQTIPPQISNF
jgi:hypothetical protein